MEWDDGGTWYLILDVGLVVDTYKLPHWLQPSGRIFEHVDRYSIEAVGTIETLTLHVQISLDTINIMAL